MPWWSVALAGAVVLYALCALYIGLASDLQSVAHAMEQTTRGDLSARAGVNGRDEVGSMAQCSTGWCSRCHPWWRTSCSNAALVAHAGQSLAQGNRSLAERTEQQAANLERTAASVRNGFRRPCRTTRRPRAARCPCRRGAQGCRQRGRTMARAVQSVKPSSKAHAV